MGMVHANITLRNAGDATIAERGLMAKSEVRQTAVCALVDTGAATLVINEWVRAKLGLKIVRQRDATLANNQTQICGVSEAIEVQWNDRSMICQALVVPGDGDVLLGAIPLEDMDLIVNPVKQELVGAHGDKILVMLK
ncbi:MAG: hypothetical protein Ta2B_02640 [Termitinemataceae bacterium]|nr:MAG: hypothetical protein Ta2B_02640 [Termitinemataceae bacterium]